MWTGFGGNEGKTPSVQVEGGQRLEPGKSLSCL